MEFQVPGYKLHESIGKGAYGIVYRATAERTRADRAIKVLVPLPFEGPENANVRFGREAAALVRLAHRGIVTCHDFGITDPPAHPFLVFDYVDGRHLRDAATDLSLEQRVECIVQLLDALEYAHGQGVFHRDIKSSNLMVRSSDGQVMLLDFGAAYVLDGATSATLTETAVGTMGYIPPEVQNDPKHRTPKHDLFSVGVVLYEVLAGRMPNRDAYAPLSQIEPRLAAVDVVVKRALAPEATRYESAESMAAALRACLTEPRPLDALPRSDLAQRLVEGLRERQEAERDRQDRHRQHQASVEAQWKAQDEIVTRAAEDAFAEAAMAVELTGEGWKLQDGGPPDANRDQKLIVLRRADDAVECFFARVARQRSAYGRNEPLFNWDDKRRVSGRPAPAPQPTRLVDPAWVIGFAGLKRFAQVSIRGAVGAGIVGAASSPLIRLHARQRDGIGAPFSIATGTEIRDYFLRAIGSALGVEL